MAVELYDNATSIGTSTFLTAPCSETDLTIEVADIASPALQQSGGQFRIIVVDVQSGETELMMVTGNAWTANWTVQRAIEGTDALQFPIGSIVKHVLTAGALRNLISQIQASQSVSPIKSINGDYQFVIGDAGSVIDSTAPIAHTFTIPAHATVPFPVGAVIEVCQIGAGKINIAGAVGVSVLSPGSLTHTASQYATIGLRQDSVDNWILSGDLG